jgi:hypothetical protein
LTIRIKTNSYQNPIKIVICLPPLPTVHRFVLIEPTTWHHIMQKIIIYVSVNLIMEFEIPQQMWKIPFKGQLISKCIFGILNSPKKRRKKLNFTTMVPQVKLFLFVFLENWRHQKDISKLTDLWPYFKCLILSFLVVFLGLPFYIKCNIFQFFEKLGYTKYK